MSKRIVRAVVLAACLLASALATAVGPAGAEADGHHPLYMPNVNNMNNPLLQPPPVCCAPVGPPSPAGAPAPVNMAYFGGHVQVEPKIYLVFWGWGQAGAFDHVTPGMPSYDPDGAAARMTAFRQGDGRHPLGRLPDPVLRDHQRLEPAHRRTRRTSSAASGTTTPTRSTTT